MFRRSAGGCSLIVVMILLANTLLLGCSESPGRSPFESRLIDVHERSVAPEVERDLMNQAGRFTLSKERGKVVVMNFWESYCAPCRAEASALNKTYNDTDRNAITLVGINVRDQKDAALAYLTSEQTPYGSIYDPSAEIILLLSVPPNSMPATLLMDKKGRIAAVVRGGVTYEMLANLIQTLSMET